MKKTIVGILLSLCQVVIAQSQNIADKVTPVVSLYASHAYVEPTDMSNVRMAVYDARHNQEEDVFYYLRRYYDDVYRAHPSVLVNKRVPSHFIVIASDAEELSEASKLITSYKKRRSVSVVLLYGGASSDLTEASLGAYSAVFVTDKNKESSMSQYDVLSQALFGGIVLDIPTEYLTLDAGRLAGRSQSKIRLAYGTPESVGMSSHILGDIDKIASTMISDQASPGCYVLIARKGVVVWSKAYGHTMYKDGRDVKWDDLYDIASVSKAFGTLPVVMRMFDEGRLSSDQHLGDFLTELDSAKSEITIADLLQHQSGLAAGVAAFHLCVDSASFDAPLYSYRRKGSFTIRIEPNLYMSNKAKLKEGIFSKTHSVKYPVQVSTSNYTTDSLRMAVLNHIDNSKMLKKSYRYSDLNFIYLQQIVERVYDSPLDRLFNMYVARPMGIRRMLYRPMEQYGLEDIVPTEDDRYFRKEQVWGTVHDQTAALLGGVAGNAGLFASANELAKVAQMYLWRGSYGGVEMIKSSTIDEFTKRHASKNRRGYGFDKPDLSGGVSVCDQASQLSYGHSGFSGTLVWVDPEYDLVYVFLSNRICPNAYNNKLTVSSVRSNVHEVAYKAIIAK